MINLDLTKNYLSVKQQHIVCFFIFTFTLKYMLGNVYINKIHARQCFFNLQAIRICYYVNKRIPFQLINKSLVYNSIAILKNIFASIVLYIFRLFTELFFLSLFMKVTKIHQWTNCRDIQPIIKLKTFFILETA